MPYPCPKTRPLRWLDRGRGRQAVPLRSKSREQSQNIYENKGQRQKVEQARRRRVEEQQPTAKPLTGPVSAWGSTGCGSPSRPRGIEAQPGSEARRAGRKNVAHGGRWCEEIRKVSSGAKRRIFAVSRGLTTYEQLQRSFAEFILSELRRFFASLRMTSEGLRMTGG